MGEQSKGHYIVPSKILTQVLLALVALTFLTVFTAQLHLGVLAGPIAFLIAIVKALLVMAYFMGLKYDDRSNRIIFSLGFIGLLVLFFFSALDIYTRILQNNTL